jgi:uncharacterized protein YdhG (YjbR/CyaY superfamily)
MLKNLDEFYEAQPEPIKSCLLALATIIKKQDEHITTVLKYGMPFFMYKGKMFCYLWVDKITLEPYIGIVEGNLVKHSLLEQGTRARMKIIRFNPNKNLPIKTITTILTQTINLYKGGLIKIKK